ncbi:MAG: hypothetical protein QF415_14980 [Candidatus Undinarchaeales archaeon]|jgi:uncharacterized protein (UPF0332 family)|nr:hypothetical protein [Candidatus Undinarchaeales archaeon]MDP7494618.1 hypothetical protein [Candidatus Undinarchaeales archaeon]
MKELREAEFWLISARRLINESSDAREKYTVIVAQCIHSIIRANDALTMKFLRKNAARHDEAIKLFHELLVTNKIPSSCASLKKIVQDGVQTKSKVDYKGEEMSKSDANRWITKAEKFLQGVKDILE